MTEEAIREIIRRYTREAVVRNLEREMSTLARKAVKDLMIAKKKKVKVTEEVVHDYLAFRSSASVKRSARIRSAW